MRGPWARRTPLPATWAGLAHPAACGAAAPPWPRRCDAWWAAGSAARAVGVPAQAHTRRPTRGFVSFSEVTDDCHNVVRKRRDSCDAGCACRSTSWRRHGNRYPAAPRRTQFPWPATSHGGAQSPGGLARDRNENELVCLAHHVTSFQQSTPSPGTRKLSCCAEKFAHAGTGSVLVGGAVRLPGCRLCRSGTTSPGSAAAGRMCRQGPGGTVPLRRISACVRIRRSTMRGVALALAAAALVATVNASAVVSARAAPAETPAMPPRALHHKQEHASSRAGGASRRGATLGGPCPCLRACRASSSVAHPRRLDPRGTLARLAVICATGTTATRHLRGAFRP